MNLKASSKIFVILMLLVIAQVAADDYEFGGYLKNLFIGGSTFFDEDYLWSIQRLRFQLVAYPSTSTEFRAELDNQVQWGSFLDTSQYKLSRAFEQTKYIDMTLDPVDNEDLLWRASVHRLYFRSTTATADFTIGRQRISWGSGRIWNPTDLFNQISPTALEPGEIPGADAIHLAVRPVKNWQFEFAGSVGVDENDTRYGAKAKTTIGSYDLSTMLGDFNGRTVLGFDFTGYVGNAGFRGEFTYNWEEDDESFFQGVLSLEYVFPNGLDVLIEYLYNENTVDLQQLFVNPDLLTDYSAITTLNRHFLATRIAMELHALLGASATAIYEIEDGSFFVYPMLTYNWKQNVDLAIGAQLFFGDEGDYSFNNNSAVATVSYYF